jgi:hypothetical protein
MRPFPLLVLACLIAAQPAAASPYLAQQDQRAQEAQEPVGEDWPNRWQGRRHWLYDDIARDAETDGNAANARANCRNVPVRMKRSDGTTFIRRINRCE